MIFSSPSNGGQKSKVKATDDLFVFIFERGSVDCGSEVDSKLFALRRHISSLVECLLVVILWTRLIV